MLSAKNSLNGTLIIEIIESDALAGTEMTLLCVYSLASDLGNTTTSIYV